MKFIKNLLKKNEYKLDESLEDAYTNNDLEFVWGILSGGALDDKASLYSLNDLDVTYNKIEKKYYLSIETIYKFKDDRAKSLYIQDLYEQFTQYMYDCNLSVNKELSLADVLTDGTVLLETDDMETLYAQFKFLVKGYLGMNNNTI